MLNPFTIGIGGAGNKTVVNAIKSGILRKEFCLLLNTTLSDIDKEYQDIAVKFGDARGGCGKERSKAKSYMVDLLKGGLDSIDLCSDPSIDIVILVTSTEGGTGSGSTLLLAKYISQVIGKPVHVFAFTGFGEDGRGLKNTVEFFQEVEEDISIECIRNSDFAGDGISKLNAEKAANESFIHRICTLLGFDIIESTQNIDKTDLFKVSTQVGYTICDTIDLPKKIKNMSQFNEIVRESLDLDEALDTSKSVKRLAVIINTNEESTQHIDFNFKVFRDRFGEPFEVYTHVQNRENGTYIQYIATGLALPLDEVKEVYDEYLERSGMANKKRDSFFDEASDLVLNQSDDMFDLDSKAPLCSKDDFFKNAGIPSSSSGNKRKVVINKKVND